MYNHLKSALVFVVCGSKCNGHIFDPWLVVVVDVWFIQRQKRQKSNDSVKPLGLLRDFCYYLNQSLLHLQVGGVALS